MISSGKFGKIFKTNNNYIVKKLKKSDLAFHEKDILKYLSDFSESSLYIIQYQDDFEDEDSVFIFTDYLEGPRFHDLILQPQESITTDIHQIFRDLLKGLSFIHNQGVVHRDIKTTNIVLSCGKPKYLDFGLSDFFNELSVEEPFRGTWAYLSPELTKICGYHRGIFKKKFELKELSNGFRLEFKRKEDIEEIFIKADIWSLGICFYFLLNKRFPFNTESIDILTNEIINKPIISKSSFLDLDNITNKMLNKDYINRSSINELLKLAS